MATCKKPPRKKLPTGPTKADLLSRMGVGRQPQAREAESPESQVQPAEAVAAAGQTSSGSAAASSLAIAPPAPAGPLPNPAPAPVAVEEVTSCHRAQWVPPVLEAELEAELVPPVTASAGNGKEGVQPLPCGPEPRAALADPRDALDAQLGLRKLTFKWSAGMVEKLGSLETATGLPGEILLEALLDHWEQLPKPLQHHCLLQAHRIRVERLVLSQNFTIATIEQLLSNC